ncbi:MAG: hypothetical protein J1E97_04720 [Muribaculaceae bacterium]|nr:hypothetical protein [Muribaculaceae bacterium]
MKNPFLLPFFAVAALFMAVLPGCISDSFTTSPSDLLEFSADTVRFDTVFTDLGTPTARLKVYNRAKKSVMISSVKLADENSAYSINVDGVSGKDFNDIEIRGGDSIFVFIECYIPEQDLNTPQLVEDKLNFVTNGVTQSVLLEAWGQNVARLNSLAVTENMTLTAEIPYVIFNEMTVEPEAVLTVEPGAKLLFHDGASLTVKGRIEAVGEPGKMIDMRGDRLDNVLPDVGYDILAGQWGGVTIAPESFGNRLEYVDMRSTKTGLQVDSCADLSRQKLLLVNSWLHNSQKHALEVNYAWVDAYGCVFSEAGASPVYLVGGQHEFLQCTFSNYYLYVYPSEPLLMLEHCMPEDLYTDPSQPLMTASFKNCILYGLSSDINPGDLTGSFVTLEYCSLKSPGSDDANFINCFWDTDPLFLTIRADYYFNYHVADDSPVIGLGNPSYLNELSIIDMDGYNRLTDSPSGTPTLGAYALPETPLLPE